MKWFRLLSDHFYNWSDTHEETIVGLSAKKAKGPDSSDASPGVDPARVPGGALQTLREAALPMCPGARPWPEVLPLGQSDRRQAPNGLRSSTLPGAGRAVPGELPVGPAAAERDLRDQPGASSPPRTIVGSKDVFRAAHQRGSSGRSGCQYDPGAGASWLGGHYDHGGEA